MNQRIGDLLSIVEKLVYIAVAVLLLIMSGYTLVDAFTSFTSLHMADGVTAALTSILNDVLFAIILMELLRTVISHVSEGGFQLRSFLIIGIISSVRRILVLGAQLSGSHPGSSVEFNRALAELGVDAGVAGVLTLALYIVQRIRGDERNRRRNSTEEADSVVEEQI